MATEIRTRGRPTKDRSEELSLHIVQTAAKLFIKHGFSGTTMEQIAKASGVDKTGLYRRHKNKQDLFVYVYNEEIRRIMSRISVESSSADMTPLKQLKLVCKSAMIALLEPEVIDLCRLAYFESMRFPELGELVRTSSLAQVVEPLAKYVAGAQSRGELPAGDPELLSQHIHVSCFAFPFLNALLGDQHYVAVENRSEYFEAMWHFVEVRLTRPTPSARARPPKRVAAIAADPLGHPMRS